MSRRSTLPPLSDNYIETATIEVSVVGGTYTLLIVLGEPATVRVGALGPRDLRAGWYAYTGNALGTGGFARIDRHRRVATGESDTRHWHVDYLLGHPATGLDGVVTTAGVDAECAVARRLDRSHESVEGFGCSDCDCSSHLAFSTDRESLTRSVRSAHQVLAG